MVITEEGDRLLASTKGIGTPKANCITCISLYIFVPGENAYKGVSLTWIF